MFENILFEGFSYSIKIRNRLICLFRVFVGSTNTAKPKFWVHPLTDSEKCASGYPKIKRIFDGIEEILASLAPRKNVLKLWVIFY